MFCTKCGEKIKPDARFCHACGTAAPQGKAVKQADETTRPQKQNWLHSFGAFLLIPIFAVIVILLFWENKDPDPIVQASSNNTAQNGAPNMAAMQQIHATLEGLKKNLAANPKDLVAMDSLAVMYSIAGSHDTALSYYKKHLEIEPDNKDIKIAMALTYHNLENDSKAVELLQEVLEKEPDYLFGLYYLAEIQEAQHNHEEATRHWQKITEKHPGTQLAKMAEERLAEQHADE